MKIAIGSDHAGLYLKRDVSEALTALGHVLEDVGAFDKTSVDYPDYAALVARAVREQRAELGVLVCGTGIGMSIAANKFRGVRAGGGPRHRRGPRGRPVRGRPPRPARQEDRRRRGRERQALTSVPRLPASVRTGKLARLARRARADRSNLFRRPT